MRGGQVHAALFFSPKSCRDLPMRNYFDVSKIPETIVNGFQPFTKRLGTGIETVQIGFTR
jgi:hypothetical protein